MQQRYYDPQIGRFLSVDPVPTNPKNGASFGRYQYAADNPFRYFDPDGRTIHATNKRDQKEIEAWVNSLAKGTFKFDKNGNLQQIASSGGAGSSHYSTQLAKAIGSTRTINVQIASVYKDKNGTSHNISQKGEGFTGQARRGDRDVTISGNANVGLLDTSGKPLDDGPGYVLMHELVAHAVPQIVGRDTGNGVDNENFVRSELGGPLRQPEDWHGETYTGPAPEAR